MITLADEVLPDDDLVLFSPTETWKKTKLSKGEWYAKEILIPIFIDGECVYDLPTTNEIKEFCKEEMNTSWDECKRFSNPHTYYVDLSKKLFDLKMELLEENSNR